MSRSDAGVAVGASISLWRSWESLGEPLSNRQLNAFRLILLIHLASEGWIIFLGDAIDNTNTLTIIYSAAAHSTYLPAILHSVALVAIAVSARLACGVAFVAHLLLAWHHLPYTANHTFLELVCLGLCATLSTQKAAEAQLLGASLRAATIVVMFYAGFQKMLYGYYFRGELMAAYIGWYWRFFDVHQWLLPTSELQRLRALGSPQPGVGPYLVGSWSFIALSNLVWIGEIAIAVGLAWPAVRTLAVLVTVGLAMGIAIAVREIYFALLLTHLSLLFFTSDVNRRLLPLFACFYFYAVLVQLRVVPWWFIN